MEPFMVWAHRGASAYAPENTLAAFRLAESQGADGVELDVHLTREEVPVVLHDPGLERVAGVRRRVSEMSLGELRGVDAGSWFSPRFRGESIPSLEDVLGGLGSRMRFNIEVKGRTPGIEARVAEVVRRTGCAGRVLVSSFDPRCLRRVRRLEPRLPIAPLFYEQTLSILRSPTLWRLLGARVVHPRFMMVTPEYVARAGRVGVGVVPWTVDSLAIARRMRDLGAAGIITNRPDRMVQLLRR